MAFVGAAGLVACSSGSGGSQTVPQPSSALLPAARATACIGASATSQTVALPAAGGVTGTVTVGAVASSTATCAFAIDVATGADAAPQSTAASASVRHIASAAASPLPIPIAQIDLTTTTTTSSWLAITLTVPASVPAGSYPATVTTTVDLGDGQTYTTTTNYTLTVSSNGTAALTGLNVTLGQYSSGVLSIYPRGTVLPTPSPAPSATATATATASASPTATPTASATPTVAPTSTPIPSPTPSPSPAPINSPAADCLNNNVLTTCGSYVANGSYDGPAGFYSPAPTPVVTTPQPLYNRTLQGNPRGYVFLPYFYFTGTVTITLNDYAPGQQQTLTNDCPSNFTVAQSGLLGDTYTLTFPANGAQSAIGSVLACALIIDVPNEYVTSGAYTLGITYPVTFF